MPQSLEAALRHECALDCGLCRLVQQTEPRPSSMDDLFGTTLLASCSSAIRDKCLGIIAAHTSATQTPTPLKHWAAALWEVHHQLKYSAPLLPWHAKRSQFQDEMDAISIDTEICNSVVKIVRAAK